jgi:hypothetical protein
VRCGGLFFIDVVKLSSSSGVCKLDFEHFLLILRPLCSALCTSFYLCSRAEFLSAVLFAAVERYSSKKCIVITILYPYYELLLLRGSA